MKRLLRTVFLGCAALHAHGQISHVSFGPHIALAAGDSPIQCAVADMDRDGKADLVVANHLDSRLMVYRNVGTGTTISASTFAAPVSFAAGSMPHDMALGDIDGDGRLDVVTGNLGDHTVSLFRNTSATGLIQFAVRIDMPAGGQLPHGVALADVDNDSRPDLLVACHDSDSVSLFRNMGSGVSAATFPQPLILPIGDGPHIVAAGDLTGDGRAEVLVSNFQTPDLAILWYVPSVTADVAPFRTNNFVEILRLPRGGNALHLGDIDGDGQTDIAVGHWRTGMLAVFRHSDPGGALLRFDPPAELSVGHSIHSVVVRDLDADSRPELVAVGELSSYMSVFKNVASPGTIVPGSFAARVDFPSGWNANGLAVGDIQGDGRPEIVFANAYDDNIFIYQNRVGETNVGQPPVFIEQPQSQTVEAGGSATFTVGVTGTQPFGYRWRRNGVTIPNSNTDTFTIHSVQPSDAGIYTVVVTNPANPAPGVISAPATLTVIGGTNVVPPTITRHPQSQTVEPGATVTFSVEATGTQPLIYRWRRNGVYLPGGLGPVLTLNGVTPEHGGFYSVIVSNIAGARISSNALLRVITPTNPPPPATFAFAEPMTFGGGDSPVACAYADLENDDKPDLIVINYLSSTLSAYRNRSSAGTIQFAPAVNFPTGRGPIAMAVQELLGGGGLDVVTANLDTNTVSVFINNSTPTNINFMPPMHLSIAPEGRPRGVAAGDVDGDGANDIVVAAMDSDSLVLFRNRARIGAEFFDPPFIIENIGNGPTAVAVTDIDADGRLDIVVACHETPELVVLRRNGLASPDGRFNSAMWDPPVRFPRGGVDVIARDVDGDSRLDLLVGDWRGHILSVFRNSSVPGTIALGALVDLNMGNHFHHVDTGDLDADGKPELVAVGEMESYMSIFKNLSTPGSLPPTSFSGRVDFPTGWNPHGVVVADVDDDNRQDITFANAYDDTITIYRNTFGATNVIEPPRFVVQPQSQTVSVGGTAIFHVEVAGTPPLGYRWRRNGVTIPQPGPGINTLIISNVQPSHAGTYSVVVTNAANIAGVLSSNAVLVVVPTNAPPPPLVHMDHPWRYDQSGNDLSASFAAPGFDDSNWPEGPAPLGVEFAPLPAPINTPLTLGQTTYYFRTALNLTAAQLNSISQFYIDTLIDDGALVYVNGNEVFRLRMPDGPVTGNTFAQGVVGDAMMEGPFYISREHFVPGQNVIAVEVHQINLASSDIVFGLMLHGVTTIETNVPPPVITEQPQSQTVNVGGTAVFHVEAIGAAPLAYRWRRNGVNIPDANTDTLVLSNVQPGDAGVYTVVVSNVGSPAPGVISAPATLTVITEPPPPGVAPVITRIHPTSGPVGSELAIEGTGLVAETNGAPRVRVGGVVADVISASRTQLVVRVPAGAMYSPVTVTVSRRTGYSSERFDVTFPAVERIRSTYFGPRVDLESGPIPVHMAGGDIDGDGYTDLVVANRDGANFTVFRNRGADGGFHPGVHFDAGNTPYQLAIGDMNGDGRLDVVTADANANTASFHRNVSSSGNVSFAPRVASTVGRRPLSVAIGDLNRDGFLDVVTGDYDDHAVSVLLGADGSGALLPRVAYSTGGDTHAVVIGDVSGDGYPDVVAANYQSGSVALLRGTAAGTLAPRLLFNGGGNTITLANVDLDDDLDLVVGNYQGSEVRVFDNVGFHTTNQFFPPTSFPARTTPHQVAVGDLNGDGKVDIAAAGEYPSQIGLLQNGSGWAAGTLFSLPELLVAQANETGVVIADFDRDGRPDVAVANAYSSTISWFRNNIPETEPPPEPPVIVRQPASQTVPVGGTAIFSVEATGTPPLTYEWRLGGSTIQNSNTNRLVIANVQPNQAGDYTVRIRNAADAVGVTSVTATLTVTPTNQVPAGNLVSITNIWRYEASGTNLGTSWLTTDFNDDAWPSGLALLGFETAPLPVPIQTMLPIGAITYYFRTVVNLDAAAINPLSRFRLHTFVDDGAVVYVNGAEAVRVGMPPGSVTYNTLATRSAEAIFEGPFMLPPSIFVAGRNVIAVEVHQGQVASGDVVFGLALNVEPGGTNGVPLVITEQPQSQTVEIGGTATFHVGVTGTPPFGYRWRRNGITIAPPPGNDTLIISNVQPSHAGVYSVVVTNAANRAPGVLSSNAVLTVIGSTNVLPPVIASFAPRSGPIGTVVTITGDNFHPSLGGNRVHFGGAHARVLSASTGLLTVEVPGGATYEPISVSTRNRIAFSDLPFIVTFASSRTIDSRSFTGFNLPAGDLPMDVSIGDMEGNGKLDLVAMNHFDSTVGVYLNHGTNLTLQPEHFEAPRISPTGPQPYHMTLADMDGDGGLDIVTANTAGNSVSLLRNTPAGVFALSPAVHVAVGQRPVGVAAGDLDKDGRVDIVTANQDGDSITILRQVSDPFVVGAASPFQTLELPVGDGPHNVVIADIDGDSRPDIAVANYHANTMSVFRNLTTGPGIGPGSFAPAVTFAPGGNCIAFGDLDGDGRGDLAIGEWNSQVLALYRNVSSPGTIALSEPATFAVGNNPHTITLSDLDGDARVDLTLVGQLPSFMCIFKNQATPGGLNASSFAPRVDFPSGWNAVGVAAGDLNGDGQPDLLFANAYDDNLTVYLNEITGVDTNGPTLLITEQPQSQTVEVGGTAIFHVGVSGTPPFGYRWRRNGITIAPPPGSDTLIISNVQPSHAGFYSVIVTNAANPGPGVLSSNAVLTVIGPTNTVSPQITQQPQNQTVPAGGTATFVVEATGTPPLAYIWFKGDMPLGGATNRVLTLTNVQTNHAGVYSVRVSNTAGSVLSESVSLTVTPPEPVTPPPVIASFSPQSGPTGTVVTIVGDNFHPSVGGNRVFFGAMRARVLTASTNTLTVEAPAGATYEPISVNTRNLTAFSDQPFIVTFNSSRRINAGSFHPFTVTAGDSPVHVSMGDMEGNGKLDFVAANLYSSTVGVYLNRSTNSTLDPIGVGFPRTYPTGPAPFYMALADIDGTGSRDVITANTENHTISLIPNVPAGVFALSSPLHLRTGQLPIAVATGDLDKDGRVDIVVANHDSDSITIFRQVFNPFPAPPTMPFQVVELPVGDGPHNVVIGDVDGDGRPDIVVANFQTPTMAVLRNLTAGPGIGTNSFAPAVHLPRGGNCLGFGDLDGDGKSDIVIGNWRTQTLSVFRNVASPGAITLDSLAAPIDFAMGNNPHTIALSDLDGDARVDIAVVGELSSYMSIFKNVSTPGTLNENSFLPRVDFSSGWNAVGIAAGDLDGDSRPELVFANAYDDNLTVYRNRTAEIGTNEPPVANLAVGSAAAVQFLSEANERVIIDPLHTGVVVRLDGSTCSDAESDLLTYEWSVTGQVIGTSAATSHTFTLGSHVVTLRVSDGSHTTTTSTTVNVITPVDAVETLIAVIQASDLPVRPKQRIIAILEDTLTIIPHDLRRADTRLEKAQQKIRLALRREDPALAGLIVDALEQIICGSRCD